MDESRKTKDLTNHTNVIALPGVDLEGRLQPSNSKELKNWAPKGSALYRALVEAKRNKEASIAEGAATDAAALAVLGGVKQAQK